jgi:hypothetical protein
MQTEVWKVEQTKRGNGTPPFGDNYFKVTSLFKPSSKDLRIAQKEFGYDPKGYGGPYVLEQNESKGVWTTVFSCAGSCD